MPLLRVTMLLDNHYGPDRRVEREAELLAEAGHGVEILAWDRREDGGDENVETSWATVHRLSVPAPPGGGLASIGAVGRFSARVWRERRRLVTGDLVYVHDIYLLPLGARLGRPFVYDAHEDYRLMEAERFPAPLLRAIEAGETRLARSARLVVVPGQTRTARWQRAGIEPLVLPNVGRGARLAAPAADADFDLVCVGNHDETKHPELLAELARTRPDLRVGAAGAGRSAPMLERAARELGNFTWLGWTDDPDAILARGRVVYYGYDPDHPYSVATCPNTLYQALRVHRPVVFFSGGEIAEAASRFRIGERVAPTAAALGAAVDRMLTGNVDWEFDAAWEWASGIDDADRYVRAVEEAAA